MLALQRRLWRRSRASDACPSTGRTRTRARPTSHPKVRPALRNLSASASASLHSASRLRPRAILLLLHVCTCKSTYACNLPVSQSVYCSCRLLLRAVLGRGGGARAARHVPLRARQAVLPALERLHARQGRTFIVYCLLSTVHVLYALVYSYSYSSCSVLSCTSTMSLTRSYGVHCTRLPVRSSTPIALFHSLISASARFGSLVCDSCLGFSIASFFILYIYSFFFLFFHSLFLFYFQGIKFFNDTLEQDKNIVAMFSACSSFLMLQFNFYAGRRKTSFLRGLVGCVLTGTLLNKSLNIYFNYIQYN